jgi:hypothetical protein
MASMGENTDIVRLIVTLVGERCLTLERHLRGH